MNKIKGFRLGIYIFKDAEVIDYAGPYGVFSTARRLDPEIDVFLISDSNRLVQTQAGMTVLPNYTIDENPALDAFLIPGGFGTRQETYNKKLHNYINQLEESVLLTTVCTGSWILGEMGLLDNIKATSRKEPDRIEASPFGLVPIDRLAQIAPKCIISESRVVDTGRVITSGGISAGVELGFHLLRRAGYEESFIEEVARIMEYHKAYDLLKDDIEYFSL